MTTSSAANRPAYALAIRVHVIEWDIDPLRKIPHFLFIAAKCSQLGSFAERVDRLPREPEQRRCSTRRDKPAAVLFEQPRELRIPGFSFSLRHCQTIVAQAVGNPPVPARSPRASA